MTLIQLECFLCAAETGSFSEAAPLLFLTRQAVSAHVKALEAEFGFPLFRRGGKSIALTDSGEVMFRELTLLMCAVGMMSQTTQVFEKAGLGHMFSTLMALVLILCFKPSKIKAANDKYRAASGKPLDDALVGRAFHDGAALK